MRHDIVGSRHSDDEVRATIKRVYQERGYLMDPHSAIAYLGLTRFLGGPSFAAGAATEGRLERQEGRIGIFLATAHPAKFSEIVEPILGHAIETPKPLADALAQPRHVLKINATFDAVRRTLDS
jgi:threonine synthase